MVLLPREGIHSDFVILYKHTNHSVKVLHKLFLYVTSPIKHYIFTQWTYFSSPGLKISWRKQWRKYVWLSFIVACRGDSLVIKGNKRVVNFLCINIIERR